VRGVHVLITLVLFLAIGAAVALGIERFTGSGSNGYLVRAVFDNSSFVIPGEEVKVAGTTVGTIHAVQLTEQNKAALVLQITNKRFLPFRTDAHCEIGLESLLGEQFVQCSATQQHPPGTPAAPPLPAIASGPDKGQHLLPVRNTTAPVGFDQLNDIMRLPERERLTLIINGLGAGLAANGKELNAALLRADPALQQTDQVIAVLASQDRLLANLTDESARVLAPLAAQRAHLGGFIRHAGAVAVASAQEGQAIEQNLQDFPPFLRQLKPAADRLSALAGQMTPALRSLQAQAPAINASVAGLGPLADASIPALKSLGKVAQRGESVFPAVKPLANQLLKLATPLLPLATDIGQIAQSFDNAGGIEDVMRFIYYYAGSVNGEDALGHYIRSLVTITGSSQRVGPTNASASQSALFACVTGTRACPTSATTFRPAAAQPQARTGQTPVAQTGTGQASAAQTRSGQTAAARTGADRTSAARVRAAQALAQSQSPQEPAAKALLSYLLAP
jgi:phospholipid/cholesterol/gamma-HCH transport system substrate-binding protein